MHRNRCRTKRLLESGWSLTSLTVVFGLFSGLICHAQPLPGPSLSGGSWVNPTINGGSFTGSAALTDLRVNPSPSSAAIPATVGNSCSAAVANSNVTPDTIWAGILGGATYATTVNGLCVSMTVPMGTTVTQAQGLGVFVRADTPITPLGANLPPEGYVSGLSSNVLASVAGAHIDGVSSALSDAAAPPDATGIVEANELDFNVTKPGTVVTGLVLTGSATVAPASAEAVQIKPMGSYGFGNAVHSYPGAATSALFADWMANVPAGNNLSSQYVAFNTTNASGASDAILLQGTPGGQLAVTGTAGSAGLTLPQGQLLLGQQAAGGASVSWPVNFLSNDAGNVQQTVGLQAQAGTTLVVQGSGPVTDMAIPSGGVRLAVRTVSTLPPCTSAARGLISAVSDAAAPAYNASVAGGGATTIPVFCNGTAWTAH